MWYVNEIVCSLNTKLLGFSNSLYIWSQYAFWSVRQMYMVKSQVKLKSIYVLLSWQCTWAALLKISHCLPLGIAILVLIFFSHFEFAGFGWLQEILYPLWNSCHLVLEMMGGYKMELVVMAILYFRPLSYWMCNVPFFPGGCQYKHLACYA